MNECVLPEVVVAQVQSLLDSSGGAKCDSTWGQGTHIEPDLWMHSMQIQRPYLYMLEIHDLLQFTHWLNFLFHSSQIFLAIFFPVLS